MQGLSVSRLDGPRLTKAVARGPLIFFHVPKTAGTTVSTLLKSVFEDRMWEAKSQHALDTRPARSADAALISGHFSADAIFRDYDKGDILTLFRDPVDRAFSQYRNWSDGTRIEWDSPAWIIDDDARSAIASAQSRSFVDFIRSDDRMIVENTRNIYVRAFCGQPDVDPRTSDQALVERAFDNIRRFLWIGLVDRLEDSMIVLAAQLHAPNILYGERQVHNRAADALTLLPDDRAAARALNQLDYALMDLVGAEFDRRQRTLLRAGVMAQLREHAPKDRSSSAARDYGWSEQRFQGGWSFEERDHLGRPYRWSLGGAEAEILLSSRGWWEGEVGIALRIINFAPDIDPELLDAQLDGAPASRKDWTRDDDGWSVRFSWSWRANGRDHASLVLRTPGIGEGDAVPHDPRANLGIALAGVGYRAD